MSHCRSARQRCMNQPGCLRARVVPSVSRPPGNTGLRLVNTNLSAGSAFSMAVSSYGLWKAKAQTRNCPSFTSGTSSGAASGGGALGFSSDGRAATRSSGVTAAGRRSAQPAPSAASNVRPKAMRRAAATRTRGSTAASQRGASSRSISRRLRRVTIFRWTSRFISVPSAAFAKAKERLGVSHLHRGRGGIVRKSFDQAESRMARPAGAPGADSILAPNDWLRTREPRRCVA